MMQRLAREIAANPQRDVFEVRGRVPDRKYSLEFRMIYQRRQGTLTKRVTSTEGVPPLKRSFSGVNDALIKSLAARALDAPPE
jgi:hypothetical protein